MLVCGKVKPQQGCHVGYPRLWTCDAAPVSNQSSDTSKCYTNNTRVQYVQYTIVLIRVLYSTYFEYSIVVLVGQCTRTRTGELDYSYYSTSLVLDNL
jgi:hypothetical protein